MSAWLVFTLMSLGTFRLTRLVVADDFPPIKWVRGKVQTARPTRIAETDPGTGRITYRWWWAGELVSCYWCASAYVAGGVVAVYWWVYGLAAAVLWWLAVWAAGALLAWAVDDKGTARHGR